MMTFDFCYKLETCTVFFSSTLGYIFHNQTVKAFIHNIIHLIKQWIIALFRKM